MDHLCSILQFTLGHLEPSPNPFDLIVSVLNLFLNRPKLLINIQLHLFLLHQVLLHHQLLPPPLFDFCLCLQQLLLLLHGFFHGFVPL